MARFRTKAVEIEAMRWPGDDSGDAATVQAWIKGQVTRRLAPDGSIQLIIPTTEGLMAASKGDWVIKGTRGEFYPCKEGPFRDKYELVEEVLASDAAS